MNLAKIHNWILGFFVALSWLVAPVTLAATNFPKAWNCHVSLNSQDLQTSAARRLAPPEIYPERGQGLFEQAPAGLYIAQGAERGFVHAALAPNITHLLLVTTDPLTLQFNCMNIALLRVAENADDYRYLRLEASHEEWLQRAEDWSFEEVRVLKRRDLFDWWRQVVHSKAFGFFTHPEFDFGGPPVFSASNYQYRQNLFKRLQTMARSGQIISQPIDLSDRNSVVRLMSELDTAELPVSVIDVGESWTTKRLGRHGLENLALYSQRSLQPDGFLLLTRANQTRKPIEARWRYIGIRPKTLSPLKQALLGQWALLPARLQAPFSFAKHLQNFFTASGKDLFKQQEKPAFFLGEILRRRQCSQLLAPPEDDQ